MPANYDDHFLALRADANLDLHFVHGVKVTATREGQAAAALADILVRGLSQTRMRRSEEHTSELQSLMRTSYAVFLLKQQQPSTTHKLLTYTTRHNVSCT